MTLKFQQEEVFTSLQEYVIKFITGVNQIINWFHQGEEQKALDSMVDAVEGLEWINQVLQLTEGLHSISEQEERINPLLIEINNALEQSDTILIADILEYEIIPIIEEWNDKINGCSS